ncbi:MAG: putative iron-regulated protein [Maribacter sp.]|jgi:uncharacterized iron-regulated protein
MMKYIIIILSFCIPFLPVTEEKAAYKIYDKKGKEVSYEAMLEKASQSDVALFGELHDNPISHWLQLEFTKDLYEIQEGRVMLGAEMFETDNQLLLNEYLSGQIEENNFEDEAKLWSNYKTDYKPLIEFAKENNTGFVATNIPRRYASMVYHKGLRSLDNLSDKAKELLPPLPIEVDMELPGYQSLLEMAKNENYPHAQAVKDACMGYFISNVLVDDGTFIHYNGAYHSDNYEGISWYIEKYAPKTSIMTISTVTQEDVSSISEENQGKADFVICVPESMTRTY